MQLWLGNHFHHENVTQLIVFSHCIGHFGPALPSYLLLMTSHGQDYLYAELLQSTCTCTCTRQC